MTDLQNLQAIWRKYMPIKHFVSEYSREELQELSDAALIVPAQANHLGLKALDSDTYKDRYALFVSNFLSKRSC